MGCSTRAVQSGPTIGAAAASTERPSGSSPLTTSPSPASAATCSARSAELASPPGAGENEGLPGFAGMDRRDDVGDRLQIDLRDRDARARTGAGDGDCHIGLGAAKRHRPPPEMRSASARKGGIGEMIDAAHLDIPAGARDAQALDALAVDESRLGDRRLLPHQALTVETMALVDALGPRRLHGPVQLARNAVEKALNTCGRRVRFAV